MNNNKDVVAKFEFVNEDGHNKLQSDIHHHLL